MQKNNWDYIIRYKEGSASSIAQEYNAIPERIKAENTEFANEIIYKDGTVNVLKYIETKVKKRKEIATIFQWITNIEITEKIQLN